MCTLIGYFTKERVIVGMNRDEKPERTHSRYHDDGLLYPVDPSKNGTWFAIDQQNGNISAVLNGTYRVAHPHLSTTRGDLVKQALVNGTDFIREQAKDYAPFELLFYDRKQHELTVFEWDMENLGIREILEPYVVLASSSYGFAQKKINSMHVLVREEQVSPDSIDRLLRSHEPKAGPESVCMHGSYSKTVSTHLIKLDDLRGKFYGRKGQACQTPLSLVKSFSFC